MAIYESPKSDLTRAYRSFGMFSHFNSGAAALPRTMPLPDVVCTSLISHNEVDRMTFRPLTAQVERRPDLDSRSLRLWKRSHPNSLLGQSYLVSDVPGRMQRIRRNLPSPILKGPMRFLERVLFEQYEYEFSREPATARDREGIQKLLGFIGDDDRIRDVRWAAYIMATCQHECAYHPIEEFPASRNGRPYNNPVTVQCGGHAVQHVYYGRGYVQLTWENNYRSMGSLIGEDLVCHPERALDPDVAYKVLSIGLITGASFANGHKLSNYFYGPKCDYLHARMMVNGMDYAQKIARAAQRWETVLLSSLDLS
jgi:putative chitinase